MIEQAENIIKSVEDKYGSAYVSDAFEDLLNIIKAQHRALELYERERDRFKHNKPELTGEYFLAGGYGQTDKNLLPQFVRICPAYGADWEQIYEKTELTI